jgi:hypothetical protein
VLLLLAACTIGAAQGLAQAPQDSAAIRGAALDYIEGWYAGDGARMERALHPDLVKRLVTTDAATNRSQLTQMSAMGLVQSTRAGGGSRFTADQQRKEVRILDIFEGTASVRIDAATWVDYLHLAKWNGRWQIVNVLWERKKG